MRDYLKPTMPAKVIAANGRVHVAATSVDVLNNHMKEFKIYKSCSNHINPWVQL